MSTTQSPDPDDRRRGTPGATTSTMEAAPQKPDRPSVLQMSVSALTAVSATALLSFVGVWGTIFGMGLLSILTVLGNYMYSAFIHHTAEKVKQARPVIPRPRTGHSLSAQTRRLDNATRTDLTPITPDDDATRTDLTPITAEDDEERPAGRLRTAWNSMVERYGMRKIVLSIVAVFVVLAGTVTAVEMLAGKPMSGIVRNEGGSGTSVFGGDTSSGSGTDDSDSGTDGSNERDGESDQREPQDSDSSEDPPAEQNPDGEQSTDEQSTDEQRTDEPPADEAPDDDQRNDESADEEPPADEPEGDQPPEEPRQEEPQQVEPPADQGQLDAPPAE